MSSIHSRPVITIVLVKRRSLSYLPGRWTLLVSLMERTSVALEDPFLAFNLYLVGDPFQAGELYWLGKKVGLAFGGKVAF